MIEVTELVKSFDGGRVRAVDEISFSVPAGSVLTLLGPSGCGKTTTMRAIAGLEKPDSGEVRVGDRILYSSARRVNLRPNQRNVGMVFQSYAIWPHMTVFDNVAYPLKGGSLDRSTLRERTLRALRLVGLEHLAQRRAPNLSGGQQQRVALARALVAEPEVLLLDEPLSNLDAKLRETMRQEIRELQQSLGITTLYVTHDQMEALAISDLVAVMSQGKIIDLGESERIYSEPRSQAVAEFIGMANVVEVTGIHWNDGVWTGDSPLGPIAFESDAPSPERRSLLIRQEDVELVDRPAEGEGERQRAGGRGSEGEGERQRAGGRGPHGTVNVWRGIVVSALYLGGHFDCVLEVGDQRMRAQVPRRKRPAEGEPVHVRVAPNCCYVLPEGDAPIGDPSEPAEVAVERSAS